MLVTAGLVPAERDMWKLQLIDGVMVKAQFQFGLRDLWIGLFWRTTNKVGPNWPKLEDSSFVYMFYSTIPFSCNYFTEGVQP